MKRLLTISLAAMMLLSLPATTMASSLIEIVEMNDFDNQGVQITINQNVLHVAGGAGQTLRVYNVTGVCVMNIIIDGADKHYDLNLGKGCYIVKVGKVVRKISIK